MGVFDFVKSGVQEMMIARPDSLKQLIVYKHPDQNVPMYAQLTVDSDECAVFFKDGRVMGVLGPGRVTLQSQNVPFLNNLITSYTGGNVFIAEIFFVKMAPVRSIPFGGPIGDMLDPLTGLQVCPRIFGEMSLKVVDPVKFIVGYSGQAAAGDNDAILDWVKQLFMTGVKTTLGELCENEGTSLLKAVSLTSKLSAAFVAHSPDLADIGVQILGVANPNINFSEEERAQLKAAVDGIAQARIEVQKKQIAVAGAAADAQARQFELDQKFGQDSRYVKELAGSYQGYAAGQAVMGAGQGMAQHGLGSGGVAAMGAQMAVGVGMGNIMAQGFAAPQAPPQPAPTFSPGGTQVTCGKCGAKQPGGKFCADCGTPLVVQKKFCSGCGTEMAAGAKFCASCGTPAGAAAPPASPG
jgi:membrane protease subunit (stomatin/prohibitin family)